MAELTGFKRPAPHPARQDAPRNEQYALARQAIVRVLGRMGGVQPSILVLDAVEDETGLDRDTVNMAYWQLISADNGIVREMGGVRLAVQANLGLGDEA